ncbi:MAG: alanine--glyoxylate aminotransferase family protein [Chloroflexi bacterium]|nr:alanine--glyoxylate aminotransferase family protein [Chloroflexota bacterium]MDA1147709.1 alanine--glyoxylate aminotransferase family protein [Chloroflexota bacterium]
MNLRIPGPTPVPTAVAEAGAAEMINHRGPEFAEIITRTTERVRTVYQTKNDVLTLTASGTGGMEAAVSCHVNPGEKVLIATVGVFGKRFVDLTRAFGGDPVELAFEFGTSIDPNRIDQALQENPDIRTLMVTHNETSTGVTNKQLPQIAEVARKHDCLIIVDAISSLSSIPVPVDQWGLDVVISGSQKGWMIGPGLVFVSCSARSWEKQSHTTTPRFYLDLQKAKDYLENGQTPSTPAVNLFFQLDKALDLMFEEGIEAIYDRHRRLAQMTRDGVRALGLELFAEEGSESDTVTAIRVPEGIDGGKLVKVAREEFDTVFAGGQGSLKGQIVRFGHLGYVTEEHIRDGLSGLEGALERVGHPIPNRT